MPRQKIHYVPKGGERAKHIWGYDHFTTSELDKVTCHVCIKSPAIQTYLEARTPASKDQCALFAVEATPLEREYEKVLRHDAHRRAWLKYKPIQAKRTHPSNYFQFPGAPLKREPAEGWATKEELDRIYLDIFKAELGAVGLEL